MVDRQRWRPVPFECPRTGQKVQALLAVEATGAGTRYENVSCLACTGIHLVDPMGGKVLGTTSDGTR